MPLPRLDVREQLRRGEEPFETIMAFLASLDAGQAWELLATFRPDPLIALLGGRGYRAEATPWPDGSWLVTFLPTQP